MLVSTFYLRLGVTTWSRRRLSCRLPPSSPFSHYLKFLSLSIIFLSLLDPAQMEFPSPKECTIRWTVTIFASLCLGVIGYQPNSNSSEMMIHNFIRGCQKAYEMRVSNRNQTVWSRSSCWARFWAEYGGLGTCTESKWPVCHLIPYNTHLMSAPTGDKPASSCSICALLCDLHGKFAQHIPWALLSRLEGGKGRNCTFDSYKTRPRPAY
jgi:hypothetical protein